jgi:hypothetical protein
MLFHIKVQILNKMNIDFISEIRGKLPIWHDIYSYIHARVNQS